MPPRRERLRVRIAHWPTLCDLYDRAISAGCLCIHIDGLPPRVGAILDVRFDLPDTRRLFLSGIVKHREPPGAVRNPGDRWLMVLMVLELDPLLSRTIRVARAQL